MKTIVAATRNKHKIEEIGAITSKFGMTIMSRDEAGVPPVEIPETGKTFEENSYIKALEIMKLCGQITVADDSGLEVDYINKEPGIYSARYLGEETPYSIKNQNIIDRLKDAEGDERSARFVCAIAAAFPDGEIITTRATIEGVIGYEEKGIHGFGYDPILYVPEFGMTTGEMLPEDKNEISHRGKALVKMKDILLDRL
jgi:XTP/dITP diphosphohydrolase